MLFSDALHFKAPGEQIKAASKTPVQVANQLYLSTETPNSSVTHQHRTQVPHITRTPPSCYHVRPRHQQRFLPCQTQPVNTLKREREKKKSLSRQSKRVKIIRLNKSPGVQRSEDPTGADGERRWCCQRCTVQRRRRERRESYRRQVAGKKKSPSPPVLPPPLRSAQLSSAPLRSALLLTEIASEAGPTKNSLDFTRTFRTIVFPH